MYCWNSLSPHSTTFRPSRRDASVASSGDGLRIAILWDVRVKAVGAVNA